MKYLRSNWLPLLVIAVGFVATILLAMAPLQFLISNTVADDSFYYFQVARNITHGLGSTFDGVNPSNGFHPLWMVLLLPIFKFFSAPVVLDVAPIHTALVLSAVLSAIFGTLLLVLVSRYTTDMRMKALALAAWFFNPFNLFHAVNGLETSLSLVFIAAFFIAALWYKDRPSTRALVVVGIVSGFMMLSRLDNVFYFLMFFSWLWYTHGFRGAIRPVLISGIAATVVVSPWLAWNYLTFGMFFTSASAAYTIVNHQLIVQDNGPSLFQKLKAIVFMTDYSLRTLVIPQTGAPSVYFTLLGLTAGFFVFMRRTLTDWWRHVPVEIFLGAGCVLDFVANASIRWSPRDWYFVAFNFLIALWIAWLLEQLRRAGKLRWSIVGIVALLVLSLYFISWSKNLRDGMAVQRDMLAAALWMNDNLPQGTVVGAFNAGTEGYFSTHRLVNLDGLINNKAYEAIRDRRVWDYIRSENIDYVSDLGSRLTYRMKSFFGIPDVMDYLTPIHETGGPTVYKIDWQTK